MSRAACVQWEVLPGGLFVFYGGSGCLGDQTYERWYEALTTSGVRRYLAGAGKGFLVTGAQRCRARGFFLDNGVIGATVTDAKRAQSTLLRLRAAVAWEAWGDYATPLRTPLQ